MSGPRTSKNEVAALREVWASRVGSQRGQYRMKHAECGVLFAEIERLQLQIDAARREGMLAAGVAGKLAAEIHEKVSTANEPSAQPVAYRKFIDSAYERHPRYTFREDTGIGAPEGWEPLYTRPALPPGVWQPIETAPRDGRKILLAANVHAPDGKPRISSGQYSTEPHINENDEVIGAEEGFEGDGDQCIPSHQECFTHWAPIPAFDAPALTKLAGGT